MLIFGLLLLIFADFCGAIQIIDTSIACDKTDFLLKIKFDDIFHGTIQSRSGDPKCIYVNGTIQPDAKYQLKIPLDGCSTHENGEGNLENEIEVVAHGEDKRFLLTCIPAAPHPKESQVTVSFGGITINADATTASSLVAGENKTLDYAVKVLDGDSLDAKQLRRPLAVGDKVTYTVEMSGNQQNGRIGRCWANDGISELPLSDSQGCSLQNTGQVWGDFQVEKRDDKTIFYNHIKAWAFPTSNEVNIFCNLHVCVTCSQSKCRASRDRRHNSDPRIPDPFSLDEPNSIDISDISPPISLRTSFRLKREGSVAKMETQISEGSGTTGANLNFLNAIFLGTVFVYFLA
ncbi:unnamed protein product [Caenorhabditis angaria]|uniref:ZP domain-containing protein n=1 Tax=Caenorhabditis angaria TaxID=860376 RepID=A0A9P1MX67_9PELO|nr:unnamed protein product [Caenorhabditis angaria]